MIVKHAVLHKPFQKVTMKKIPVVTLLPPHCHIDSARMWSNIHLTECWSVEIRLHVHNSDVQIHTVALTSQHTVKYFLGRANTLAKVAERLRRAGVTSANETTSVRKNWQD